jgi:hypothetical protein
MNLPAARLVAAALFGWAIAAIAQLRAQAVDMLAHSYVFLPLDSGTGRIRSLILYDGPSRSRLLSPSNRDRHGPTLSRTREPGD